MPWFGSQASFYQYGALEDIIRADNYTMSEAANPISMTVYLRTTNPIKNVKCAIYDSDSNLYGYTEERAMDNASAGWYTFDFESCPILANGEEYYISAWMSEDTGQGNCGFDNAGSCYYMSRTYNGWPDPVSFSTLNGYTLLIYCTYELPYTSFKTPIGSPTSWAWTSGQFDVDTGMRIYVESGLPLDNIQFTWGTIESSADYYYPSGSPTSWQWSKGNA